MNNGPGTLFELPSQRMYSINVAKAEAYGFMRGDKDEMAKLWMK